MRPIALLLCLLALAGCQYAQPNPTGPECFHTFTGAQPTCN